METKYYPLDKSRFILIVAIFIILAIGSLAGLFFLFHNPNKDGNSNITTILVCLHIIGVLGTIISLLDLALDKKGLTINNDGITFNAGLVKFGPVAWEDITAVDKKRYMLNDFVIIHLKDPGAFLTTKKGIAKKLYHENHSAHGSPTVINITQINGGSDAIIAEINIRLQP